MFRRFIFTVILSSVLIFFCLLFLNLFEPCPRDKEIKLGLSVLISYFSYWLIKRQLEKKSR
ncbi:hypothetical protein ACMGGR_03950 [Erwinia sp. BNK-24-b]|uniref:hypothetical protein n=1 Tax=unclassified Erwinia TaxID=2622719 RepID=UPI0039BF9E54